MAKISKKEKAESSAKAKRLVLLDSHAILHRAFHALPDFSTGKGEPTGALYGLSAMLIKIINDLKPDYVAACFDLAGPTFRHDAYEGYKAKRIKTDDNLITQINRSRDIFKAFSIPIYEYAGFEADDMLGTIVEQVSAKGGFASGGKEIDVIIASGDMDTMQLINDKKVRVYTLKKGINDTIIYDEKAVIERFGFPPKLLPDYKGLRGDPSDNIIGIAGIGEKTATDLIVNFGTIENIYKKLKKDKEAFVKVGIKERIIKLLEEGEEEAEFSKELATIRKDAPIEYKIPNEEWTKQFKIEEALSLFSDLEFRALSRRIKEVFGKNVPAPEETPEGIGTSTSESIQSVGESDIKEVGLALWVINSNYTNPTQDDIYHYAKTNEFEKAKSIIFAEIKKQKLDFIYEKIEKPLIPILKKMHERGIQVDTKYLKELSKEYTIELQKFEKVIYRHAGFEFNINSPKQLGEALFEKMGLGLKNQKKTSTGQKSTRESELEKMKELHPIIAEILSYRELQKLLSTYIDNIPEMVGVDGRLHCDFIPTGSTTGRFSSANPNMQNIPIKTELGRRIRSAFIAERGFLLASFDYSQIELKVAAFLSGDEKLIEIFSSEGGSASGGKRADIHTSVAAQVFGVPEELVDKEMRRQAKVINFGILYGMGVNALKQNLGTNRADAQKFYNDYFKNFSGIANYLNKVKAEAFRKGYTETFFGRRRYFEGIKSPLPFIRAAAERMAINAPIQGTQADIIKIAMSRIEEMIKKEGLEKEVFPLLQIHDELIYEIKEDLIESIAPKIQKIMEDVILPKEIYGIRLNASFSKGKNWGEMY
ncbi:MAG: DNA polymerase [Patescibacteria group bacterium]